MGEALEKIGGSVMNLVLGALIVWVGQTTYQHAGILAGLNDKFANIEDKFVDTEKRQEGLRKWLDSAVTEMKDNARSQFTVKEGDKLVSQIRHVEGAALELERKFGRQLQHLELQLVALQATGQNAPQVAALQAEVAQLRFAISGAAGYAPPYTTAPAMPAVSQQPTYLPPVSSRR